MELSDPQKVAVEINDIINGGVFTVRAFYTLKIVNASASDGKVWLHTSTHNTIEYDPVADDVSLVVKKENYVKRESTNQQ
jgi:hypothetical protein